MTLRSPLPLLIATLAVVLVVGGLPLVAADAPSQPEPALSPADIDADEIRMDIALQEDGSAEWTIEFWVELEDDERADAFDSLREDIDENPDDHTSEFADRIDETVTGASEATGREMAAEDVTVATERQSLTREYGVVRYTFQWHGFAAVEGDELHAGDAIEGLYVDDGTRLLISWPEAYEATSVTPEPDDERDRAVIWHGSETDFVDGEPRVVVAPAGLGLSWGLIGGAVAGLGVLAVLGFWWYRTRASDDAATGTVTAGEAADGSTPEPGATDGAPPAEEVPDPDLLSNEEQVMLVLERHGGRIKQQTVVEELDWTDAKTSKVVGSLREEGKIESFRIGRENVLTVPEESLDEVHNES